MVYAAGLTPEQSYHFIRPTGGAKFKCVQTPCQNGTILPRPLTGLVIQTVFLSLNLSVYLD
jgi:hypothetical protein